MAGAGTFDLVTRCAEALAATAPKPYSDAGYGVQFFSENGTRVAMLTWQTYDTTGEPVVTGSQRAAIVDCLNALAEKENAR